MLNHVIQEQAVPLVGTLDEPVGLCVGDSVLQKRHVGSIEMRLSIGQFRRRLSSGNKVRFRLWGPASRLVWPKLWSPIAQLSLLFRLQVIFAHVVGLVMMVIKPEAVYCGLWLN